jgi:FkbM family methyltransferase
MLASNEHGAYYVPRASRHRPVARAVAQARVWEPDTLDLLRGSDPAGDVVHAGTFFGDFLPALARSRRDGAVVWAFEPNLENYRCARVTTMLNDLDSVVLTHAALGAQQGTALLATSNQAGLAAGGGSHIVADPSGADASSGQERVDVLSIDEVIARDRRVATIQLDVEGHEQPALAGAIDTIRRWRPVIVLESLPEEAWIAEHLAPLGYRLSDTVDANSVLRCE